MKDQLAPATEERFRALADNAPVMIWASGLDMRCTWFNQRWLDFVGQSLEHELGDGWAEGVHPDDLDACLRIYRDAFEARKPFSMQYRLRRHDGAWRWVLDNGAAQYTADGVFEGYLGSCIDVTDWTESTIKLERALAEVLAAERLVRAQVERLDLLHRITQSISGREDLRSVYATVLRGLEDNLGFAFGCICDYVAARREVTVIPDTAQLRALATRLCLTDRSRDSGGNAEDTLTRALSGPLVYEVDTTEGESPFCRRMAQAGFRSVVAAPLRVDNSVFGVLVVARRMRDGFSDAECEFLERLSEHVALAAHQRVLYSSLQHAYNDLRQTQQGVIDQERLRILGQMTSGIAHDVANGLSPIALYVDTILEHDGGVSDTSREYLHTIQRAVEDVGQTLGRLREFSRPRAKHVTMAPVDLNALVEQVKTLTRARWKDMPLVRGTVIDMITEPSAELPVVLGAEAELREALTNVVINAVDAMPLGGTIRLRTRVVSAPHADDPAGPTAQIEVQDTGIGMSDDTCRRCLEPFFTTKGAGGTGLGLAMVSGVVQRHGAWLDIDSAVGVGTTVRITFAPQPVAIAEPVMASSSPESVRPLRVLVIDQDPALAHSLNEVLQRDGHRVVAVNDGTEGVRTFSEAEEHGDPFDVVLTDLAMPHINGDQVAAEVKALNPGALVVLLTGWDKAMAHRRPSHVDLILGKPPRLQELRAALGRVATVESH